MAHIVYSCAGEGRGHAVRVRALVDVLKARHKLTILAPRDAYALLSRAFAGEDVRVMRIPGLFFRYDRRHRVDYLRTGWHALGYAAALPALVADLADLLRFERADLAITDFDPALPRAAARAGLPYVSVDHQSFLRVSDLSLLPLSLRLHARFMEAIVRLYYDRPVHRVSSSFYRPPLRPGLDRVTQVGVFLRPALLSARPTDGEHLLAYFRRELPDAILDTLADGEREVRLYGLGERPARGRLRFFPVSEAGFLEDLASARALVTTAGNQLVGEAHALHKPVLAIPEPGNQEQRINGLFLERLGGGECVGADHFHPGALAGFLQRIEQHREVLRARPREAPAAVVAAEVVERVLAARSSAQDPGPAAQLQGAPNPRLTPSGAPRA